MNARPLFSTGSARGGTGLVTRMLSISPEAEIALDPFLALFKAFRQTLLPNSDPAAPFQDYYFTQEKIKSLDQILAASANLEMDPALRPALIESLKRRAALSSGDLVAVMDQLQGETFSEWLLSGLDLIQKTRKKFQARWIGIHENWAIEFLPMLARGFSQAQFLIILRDPRAVIASNLAAADPLLRGHLVSYARSLRKLMALTFYYQTLPVFKGRLFVIRHEDLIQEPESWCRRLCNFLEIPFTMEMLDTEKYVEPATGGVYNGFSSFEPQARGFSPHRAERWREKLSPEAVDLIDFVCGPEMLLFGYSSVRIASEFLGDAALLQTMEADGQGPKAWRCDFGTLPEDFGYEMFRRLLLQAKNLEFPEETIRLSFLFRDVYAKLIGIGQTGGAAT